jgi:hypothetical protein
LSGEKMVQRRKLFPFMVGATLFSWAILHAATKPTLAPTDQTDAASAAEAVEQLLAAFVAFDQVALEGLIEPEMLGYSRVVTGIKNAAAFQKQLRIALNNTRALASGDIVRIQTRWEKRFVSYPAMKPARRSGSCTFVMHRAEGVWRLKALDGSNPFSAD